MATEKIKLTPDQTRVMSRILDFLDEDDDVQAVYHNWDEPEDDE